MRKLPFDKEKLEQIAKTYPTPFHIYDAEAIRENARRLRKAFAWNKGFREYFAVKAAPNPELMRLLKEFDFGSDCSSMAELAIGGKELMELGFFGPAIGRAQKQIFEAVMAERLPNEREALLSFAKNIEK